MDTLKISYRCPVDIVFSQAIHWAESAEEPKRLESEEASPRACHSRLIRCTELRNLRTVETDSSDVWVIRKTSAFLYRGRYNAKDRRSVILSGEEAVTNTQTAFNTTRSSCAQY